MVSLNPFKKKEDNSYSLDQQQLPSLSQLDSSQQSQSQSNLSQPNTPSGNLSSQPQQDFSNPFQQNTSSMQPQDLSQPSSMEGTKPQQSQDESNYHHDYSKAKLDSIDSKVALLEAKFSSLEQKMDTLIAMVSEEVSEETKAKLQKSSIQNTLREKQQ